MPLEPASPLVPSVPVVPLEPLSPLLPESPSLPSVPLEPESPLSPLTVVPPAPTDCDFWSKLPIVAKSFASRFCTCKSSVFITKPLESSLTYESGFE